MPRAKPVSSPPHLFSTHWSILFTALAALVPLALLHLDSQFWGQFAVSGGQIYRGVAVSALVAGFTLALLIRGTNIGRCVAALALGWSLWGLMLHSKPGLFQSLLPPQASAAAATTIFFTNAPSQALSLAIGFLLAGAINWMMQRFFGGFPSRPEMPTKKPFATALNQPMAAALVGSVALSVLGLPTLLFNQLSPDQLPSPLPVALLCDLASFVAFGLGGLAAGRFYRATNFVGLAIAPAFAVAALGGLFFAAKGDMPPLRPFALLLWHSSPLEMTSFGALGCVLSGYFARRIIPKP